MKFVHGDNLKNKIDAQIKANYTPFDENFILNVLAQLSFFTFRM
jgi:hypothetical protein